MTEILRDLINLPLRLVLGVCIFILLLCKRGVPQELWDVVTPRKIAKIIPLR